MFEYTAIAIKYADSQGDRYTNPTTLILEAANKMAEKGWEMVGIVNTIMECEKVTVYFKRPKKVE